VTELPQPTIPPDASPARADLVARLFREHNRALVSFLTARLHSEQDAREVAQEAYVRILQLDKPEGLSFLKAYLFKTAANLAVDRMRARAIRNHPRVDELFNELEEPVPPEREVLAQQELEAIGRRLSGLPSQCRYAFAMHVLLERPIKDIAAELRLSERMVRYYVVQGLERCRGSREVEP
jgi:RNA polymerase sigma-70 factor (ECF subfamily)